MQNLVHKKGEKSVELSECHSNTDAVSNSLLLYTMSCIFFCFLLVRSRTIGELLAPAAPFDKKCGRENWTVAFAPDGSYFAWSQGHRTVKLVPWSQCLKNL